MKSVDRRTFTAAFTLYMLIFPIVQLFTVLALPSMMLYHSSTDTLEGTTYVFLFMNVASIILAIPSFIGGILMIRGKEAGLMISSIVLIAWFFLLLADSVQEFMQVSENEHVERHLALSKTISTAVMLMLCIGYRLKG
ncbi:MAG: hypothetical protein QXS98_02930 [Candidatus Nitrosocaldus sp.]